METKRKSYPSDVSDEEWTFVAPYLTLRLLNAAQRTHDQGYTGEETVKAAQEQGITLEVVKLPEAKWGFVLLPQR